MSDMRSALFAFIAVILLGCLDSAAAQPRGPEPTATTWVLQRGRDIPKRPPRTPKLHMDGKKLSGSTGCNSFTAALVEKADKRIAIEGVALTRMLCADNLDKIETAFVRALEDTQYLEEKGRKLTFLSGKREPLLVWTRSQKSAAPRAMPGKRSARHSPLRRYARLRHQRRSAFVAYRGCWGWLTSAPARGARVLW